MKISLCVIARDEESCVGGMLESARFYVDEIIFVDTGSTDKTVEVASQFTDKMFHRPWDNSFANARNFSVEQASGDWILVLDCDERLADAGWEKLRFFLSGVPEQARVVHPTMVMCRDNGQPYQEFLAERLFRNNAGVVFKGDMHNWLDVEQQYRLAAPEFRIYHRRDVKAADARAARANQRVEHAESVFLKKIAENPKDRRSLFYLAGTYFDAQRLPEAVKWLTQYLQVSDWSDERYQGSLLLGDALKQLGEYERAKKAVSAHIIDGHDRAEAFVLLGNIALDQGEYTEAEHWFNLAKTKSQPASPMFVDVDSYTWGPCVGLFRALTSVGRIGEAGDQAKEALSKGAPLNTDVLKWTKNHTQRRHERIACFVDRGQINFLAPLIDNWKAAGHKVEVTEAQDIALYEWADTIWCEWAGPLAAWITSLPHRCKVIVRLHGYEVHSGIIKNVNWGHVDSAIFVADYLVHLAAKHVPGLPHACNYYVVPGGVDTNSFAVASKTPGSIGMLGFVNERKNIPLALQILAKCPNHTLHIAGEWQSDEVKLYTEHMAQQFGISDRLKIDGFVEDKNAWLADKEFILSTSVRETTHYSVAEGMAAGCKPVVHAWLSAHDIYPDACIFRTVDEAVDLLQDTGNAQEYRDYAKRMLDVGKNITRVNRILERPFVTVSGQPGSPFAFEHKLLLACERLGCATDAPNPDTVIMTGKSIRVESWHANATNVLWHCEQVVGDNEHAQARREQIAPTIPEVDAVFCMNPHAVDVYKSMGAKHVECLPCIFAAPPFCRQTVEKKHDVGFCGIINERRKKILKRLGKRFDMVTFENADHTQLNAFYNECKIVVNLHYTEEPNLEMRIGEALSAGTCVVSEPLPAQVPGVMQTKKLAATIETLLDNDTLRSDLADEGYYWVWRESRIEHLLERVLNWADVHKGQARCQNTVWSEKR